MRRFIAVLILAFVSSVALAADKPSAEGDAKSYVPSWKHLPDPILASIDWSMLFMPAQDGRPWSMGVGIGPGLLFSDGKRLSPQLIFLHTDDVKGSLLTVPLPHRDYDFLRDDAPQSFVVRFPNKGADTRIMIALNWSVPVKR